MTTHPASKMGCLMPNSSVMGVWIRAIVVGGITYDSQIEEGRVKQCERLIYSSPLVHDIRFMDAVAETVIPVPQLPDPEGLGSNFEFQQRSF
jgi:hypothetical protein